MIMKHSSKVFLFQPDGSSVVPTNIATLNNARVLICGGDPGCKLRFVDYNYENIDAELQVYQLGTLRIPAFSDA